MKRLIVLILASVIWMYILISCAAVPCHTYDGAKVGKPSSIDFKHGYSHYAKK